MEHLVVAGVLVVAVISLTWRHLSRLRANARDAEEAKRRVLSMRPSPPPAPPLPRRRFGDDPCRYPGPINTTGGAGRTAADCAARGQEEHVRRFGGFPKFPSKEA